MSGSAKAGTIAERHTCELRVLTGPNSARSSEARFRRIFFSLTKTYMEVGKADSEGSFSLVAQFRFCRSRHLESAVCNRDIVPLSESKRDRAEIGFAPVRLRRSSKAVHR